MEIQRQAEAFAYHLRDRPSESDLAEEDWERERRRKYPRGYGPPRQTDDDPDPYLATLEDQDPGRFIDPGFVEEEVDLHPDPDHMRDYRRAKRRKK